MHPIASREALHSPDARHKAWLALWLCAAGLMGGCASSNKASPLEVRDDGPAAVQARSVWRIDPHRGHGIEIDFAQQRGRDTSSLGPGERVQFGAAVINGPETLRNEATIRSLHVAYNYLIPSSGPFEAEFFAGAGRMDLKLRVQGSAPAAQIGRTLGGGALVAGIGPRWKLSEQFALEGRLSVMSGLHADTTYEKDSIEVALAYRPVRQMSLRAGYSWIKAVVEHDTRDSDVTARLRGPYFGLTLNF
jgi:hypothetical protein